MPGPVVGWERVAGNTGGTVGGLAVVSDGSAVCVYAATPVGVFRSLDRGGTWTLAGVQNTVPFGEAVVPSARFERDRTLFLCAGDGLYRSSDAGEAWQPVLVGGRMLCGASARTDEREGVVLLAGTEADGVLRSEDGGRSWAGANAGLVDLTALTIGVSPEFASDRLGFAGTASGLYRTRNGARSWREVEIGLTEPAVQCVAISPMFGQDRLVLAGTESDGLLRSDDGGATWERPVSLRDEGVTAIAFSSRYGSRPVIAAAIESGVVVSEDRGRTWRRGPGAPAGVVLSLVFVAAGDGDSEVLLAGLHRHGVARSVDLGASWEAANDGLSARLLTGFALSAEFARDQTLYVSGPQDGVSASRDAGRTWTASTTGLDHIAVLALAASPQQTLYAASAAGIHVSHDAANTWHPASSPAPALTVASLSPAVDARTVNCVASDGGAAGSAAGSPQMVVAALADGSLVASDDRARTWRGLAPVAAGAEVLVLALSPDYARDRTLFVATRQATELVVWRSTDAGERWNRWLVDREVGAASGQRFVAVAVSPTYATDESVFVGLGARVFTPVRGAREVRAGQRRPVWRAAVLGDGAVAVTAIAPAPSFAHDRTLFAATNAGVFVSRDAGATFEPWSEGLVPPSVVALATSPAYAEDRLIYALGLGGTISRRRDV